MEYSLCHDTGVSMWAPWGGEVTLFFHFTSFLSSHLPTAHCPPLYTPGRRGFTPMAMVYGLLTHQPKLTRKYPKHGNTTPVLCLTAWKTTRLGPSFPIILFPSHPPLHRGNLHDHTVLQGMHFPLIPSFPEYLNHQAPPWFLWRYLISRSLPLPHFWLPYM